MASIIEKGTPAHAAHIEGLKLAAEGKDKLAASDASANLKLIETKKVEVKTEEPKKDK